MQFIETTAHVGSDGMLRLAVPLEHRDQDVRVAVVVELSPPAPPQMIDDAWASVRGRLENAGLRVPAPGVDNAGPTEAVELPGVSASQMLIYDRR